MHSPPLPSLSLLGAAALQLPTVAEGNYKGPLKELYDHFSHCGNLLYRVQRVPGAASSDGVQWTCSLTCPTIVQPVTGDVLLPECSFQALGRNKKEAEQTCARQALSHIHATAPELGVAPLPPLYTPAGSSAVPPSTLSLGIGGSSSLYSAIGSPAASERAAAPPYPGAGIGLGSIWSSVGAHAGSKGAGSDSSRYTTAPSSLAGSGSAAAAGGALRPPRQPSEQEIDGMSAEEARAALRAALDREARLLRLLTRIHQSIEDEPGWVKL